MDGTALLELRGVEVSYGPLQVLFGVDLDVHRGEVLALLGTNGAGKSTVLRVAAGLTAPDRGTVHLDGREVTAATAPQRVRRGLALMEGGKAVFAGLTVRENLVAGLHGRGRGVDVDAAVDVALARFPILRPRLGQRAGTLSGGEQQALGLAKALAPEPSLLLIDELSLGLAPALVEPLLVMVEELRAAGVTVVVVEQSVNVALGLADRAVFMEKGEVRFSGPAAELRDRDDLLRAVFLGAGAA